MPVSILLAEDHLIFRQDVRLLLESHPDLQIVGEATNGREAIALAEGLCPDIIVLDLVLPGMNGLEVLNRLRRQAPKVRVVILSMYAEEAYVRNALDHGASGYVLKEDAFSHLVPALREAIVGRRYLSPLLQQQLERQDSPSP
jgi:DNA-binding NarL/FixJ family response regulator